MELQGAGGFGTGIVLHKCTRASFELPKMWDLTGTTDDPWLKNKLSGLGQQPITWTLSARTDRLSGWKGFCRTGSRSLTGASMYGFSGRGRCITSGFYARIEGGNRSTVRISAYGEAQPTFLPGCGFQCRE